MHLNTSFMLHKYIVFERCERSLNKLVNKPWPLLIFVFHHVIYSVSIDHDSPSCAWSGAMCDARLVALSGKAQFFLGHRILRPFFLVNVFVLDDMSRTLLDDSIPLWLRLAVLRDGPGTLPFSSLPSYLSVLRSIWEGWRWKHPLTPELCAALLVHARRALGTLPCISQGCCSFYVGLFWWAALCRRWREHVAVTNLCFTCSGSCWRSCKSESGDTLDFFGAWLYCLHCAKWFSKMFCSWLFERHVSKSFGFRGPRCCFSAHPSAASSCGTCILFLAQETTSWWW